MAFLSSPSILSTSTLSTLISNPNHTNHHNISSKRRSKLTATAIQPVHTRTLPPAIVDVFAENGPNARPRRASQPRPVVIVPGYATAATDYHPMAQYVRQHLGDSSYVTVVPLTSRSWLKTLGGKPVTSILEEIDKTVKKTIQETGIHDVTIVAHSAGGWISRIYLGDIPYPQNWVKSKTGQIQGIGGSVFHGERFVGTLLCLGTPHKSSEPVAKHNMNFVNDTYPGAYYKSVRYLNFAGDGGSVQQVEGNWWKFWERDWFTKTSYRLTNGHDSTGAVVGDGIVPMQAAFLDNAHENILLKGVWHAPVSRGPWYGHPQVVEYWSSFLR